MFLCGNWAIGQFELFLCFLNFSYIYHELYLYKIDAIYLQNNSIHAIIRNNIAKKFKPLLQEGKFYELSYFQVVDGNALYWPVDNDIKIMFKLKTSIKEIKEIDVDIPRHKFEFVDYNKIHERVNKHVQLSGISIYIMRYIKFFNNYALYYCYIWK